MTGAAPNPIYAGLFGDPETETQFTAEAEIAAMIRVEVALAQVQGDLGVIPGAAADALVRGLSGVTIAPDALTAETARNGVPIPALVQALRDALPDGQGAGHLHWGATSQDIMDTGLALRLAPVLTLWQARLGAILGLLADQAASHADLPMAARTYGQVATPTSFGAVVAGWGWPLIEHRAAVDAVGARVLRVSLAGAAGTLSAMGPEAPQVRAALGKALDLDDPGRGWHADRSGPVALAGWAAGLAASIGKIGEDLLLLTQSGLGLVTISGGGSSSTMPQKQNPVGPSAMVALARHVIGLSVTLHGAGLHRQSRDGAAWFTEWLTLPQLCVATGAMLRLTQDVLGRLSPDAAAMARDLAAGHGLIHAEAITFAATRHAGLSRTEAATRVKALCRQAQVDDAGLPDLAAREWPEIDWPAAIAESALGVAPDEARSFASRIRDGA